VIGTSRPCIESIIINELKEEKAMKRAGLLRALKGVLGWFLRFSSLLTSVDLPNVRYSIHFYPGTEYLGLGFISYFRLILDGCCLY
jgi:hypothetical protein